MSGLVYSYSRFSDPRQAGGHSLERQASYAAKWAAEHGLRLDESLTLQDEGLSAYHQKHVKSGALGVFLAAIEDGRIPIGSTLVVEGLDRLSRAEPLTALAQMTQIVNAGISVVTASDNQTYSRARIKENPMVLLQSLLIMIRAHEESETKSKRVTASIVRKCKDWQANTWRGKIRNGKDPHWLKETESGFELVPERATALREVVAMYLRGLAGTKIAERLREAGMSPTSDKLVGAHIYKILKNQALIGIKQLKAGGESFDLAGYYPPVLTETEWSELQAAGGQRGRRGAKSTIPHVITGLGITYCGYCGCAMSGQHLFGKIKKRGDRLSDGYRRLLCAGINYGNRCPHPKSRSVAPVERSIMSFCSDIINLRALNGGDKSTPLRSQLAKMRTRQTELDAQLTRLMEVMLTLDAKETPAAFAKKARELEAERKELDRDIQNTEHQLGALARSDIEGTDAQWRALADGVQQLDYDARLQARQLVADTFERIVVYASTLDPIHGPEDAMDVLLVAKGGTARMLRVDKTGAWEAGAELELET